jgi:hypothetical protein
LSTLRSAPDAATFNFIDGNTQYEVDSVEIGTHEVVQTPPPEPEDEDENGDDGF